MENQDKIDWDWLSCNTNINAIILLTENQDKINWYNLSKNPSAILLLKANQDKINWASLSLNPNIFANDITKYNNDINNLQSVLYLINQ